MNTSRGAIVAWLDRTGGNTNVYAKQFTGIQWVQFTGNSASGTGISGSTGNDVQGLGAGDRRTKAAVAWTQTVGGNKEIYVRENATGANGAGSGRRWATPRRVAE